MTRPTRQDYEDYMVLLYFGRIEKDKDYLPNCINRAYLDFCRTLHKLSRVAHKDEIVRKAKEKLCDEFRSLQEAKRRLSSQNEFDEWHRRQCENLKDLFLNQGFPSFHIGQAQKWINMTFKYVYTLGNARLPDFDYLYNWCHVPFDNVILDRLNESFDDFPPFKEKAKTWSRIDDYDDYLDHQKWIRRNLKDVPLDAEFILWRGENVLRKSAVD